ncbi:MAG TPA: FtsX-like permease family protein [Vicinamibacterales bacterium]|nr:FtsX-like permease family protein [Vicinamibacterales bacterium]
MAGDLSTAADALHRIAARTEPPLRVTAVQPHDQVNAGTFRQINFWVGLVSAISISTLIVALSGLYAVTSFAVSRRTREIGIRAALGSSRGRLICVILRGPLLRLALGIALGWGLTVLLSGQTSLTPGRVAASGGYAAVMCGVCLLACVAPARRAMAVDPIEALRAE